jgi:tetratricopeptide (TPR) repeat protein
MPRSPRIHHCTSEPYRFFGREAEVAALDAALAGGATSLVAFVGPGGQGKTAIMQHWLGQIIARDPPPDGVFLWSFYRGKDADLCLRELFAYAEDLVSPPDVSASFCVDRLLPRLRRERWALVLDGVEVAQYESGPWYGRFLHPELGRLLEELASAPMPGVVVITSRFPLPELERRRHAAVVTLGGLDETSASELLRSVGVTGNDAELRAAAAACGHHAKAVELLGTFLVRYHGNAAGRFTALPETPAIEGASEEEQKVARVLAGYQAALPQETQDVLALATAFRDPPAEPRLREYLASEPVHALLHQSWKRTYPPFGERPAGWIAQEIDDLVRLRLLERVGGTGGLVIDAHPLVRRSFEHALGAAGRRQSSQARAGFLRGRPDRRRPATLDEAREDLEMFHAFCEAGLWEEADLAYEALDKPRYRFVAPALERDLLLRFFPEHDWRRPPLWPRFRHYRSLAICLELLGQFEEAIAAYRADDAPLRGDALIALGRLQPLLDQPRADHPWQILWQCYRAHALALAGRLEEAEALVSSLVPTDIYEWTHVFECLLRLGKLSALDMHSFLYRPPNAAVGNRWADLARQRMRLDYLRVTGSGEDLGREYAELIEAYDQGGLPFERALSRLGYAHWLIGQNRTAEAAEVAGTARTLAKTYGMKVMEADAGRIEGELGASVAAPTRPTV